MSEMFCFQCEQTAGGKGCTHGGVCGKKPEVAALQDDITAGLITLARALDGKPSCASSEALFMDALFMCVTNVNFDHGFELASQVITIGDVTQTFRCLQQNCMHLLFGVVVPATPLRGRRDATVGYRLGQIDNGSTFT